MTQRFLKLVQIRPAPVAILGSLAVASAGLKTYTVIYEDQKWIATLVVILGLLLFIGGAAHVYRSRPLQKPIAWLSTLWNKTGQTSVQLVYLLLALLFGFISALAAGLDGSRALAPGISITVWLAGICLIVLGSWHPKEPLPRMSKKTLLISAGLFAASSLLRAWAATDYPPLLNGDEASAGLSAVRFIQGEADNIFGIGWFSFPSFYYAIQSVSIRIFGQTTFALRITSALIGGLTVSAVYLVGKRLFNQRAGLLAALFLAGSHFHNHFSRIGLNNNWDAFWYIISLGLLVDGWRNQRRSSFIFSGFAFGMAQYFYTSSRFLAGIFLIWLLAVLIFNRKRVRGNRLSIVLLLLCFLVVVLPSLWFFANDEGFYNFLAPFNRVDAFGDWLKYEIDSLQQPAWKILADLTMTSTKTFISIPVQVWYPARVPILRSVSAVLFLAGVILMLFKLKKPVTWMLFLWVGVFILIGALSIPASSAQRYVAVIPACALIIGFGMNEIIELIASTWQGKEKILTAAAIVLLVGLGINDTLFYFNEYSPNTDLGGANTLVAQRLAEYLEDEQNLEVAFFGGNRMGYYSISSIPYLAPQVDGYDFNHPWGDAENPDLSAETLVFVFLPDQEDNLWLVEKDFPQGDLLTELDRHGNLLYWLYRTPNQP
jgi:4-amino-4-deoxy-L-arabinose transferase-like glycosyltransferase